MPSSRVNHVPAIISLIRQLQPSSILDVGVGFGKWGHLFREYTDIVAAEHDPNRYQREHWQVRIDGIEGHAPYITPMHRYLYNEIHLGDMREVIHKLGRYDVIFIGDVIEHLEKADGEAFLKACLEHASKAVIASTPGSYVEQDGVCGNPLEVHRSFWTAADFARLGRCVARVTENDILVAALLKEGVPELTIDALGHRGRRKFLGGLRAAAKPVLIKMGLRRDPARRLRKQPFVASDDYWEKRYRAGGDSGPGSYGHLAEYKAKVINEFITMHRIQSVIEFGSGDGNQLSLLRPPRYIGLDVASSALERLRQQFAGDKTKSFHLYGPGADPWASGLRAELGLSLDVIYHLVEHSVFEKYMCDLFAASERFVIVYSSNDPSSGTHPHVRDRRFSDFIDAQLPQWKLAEHLENPHRAESRSDFFIYQKRQ